MGENCRGVVSGEVSGLLDAEPCFRSLSGHRSLPIRSDAMICLNKEVRDLIDRYSLFGKASPQVQGWLL
jgi:hypothetical protein